MDDSNATTAVPVTDKLRAAIRSRRAKRIGIGALAAVALYGLLGFFAAPPLIRHVAETQLHEQLGRPATIGRVALNPFLLRLEADDIHIGGRKADEAFVDVGQLAVRVSWASLTRFAPVVAEVGIVRPRVHIVRYDAQNFNFSDLAETSTPAESAESKPLDLTVEKFSIADGTLSLDDASTSPPTALSLTDLATTLENLSLRGETSAAYSLAVRLASGGAIAAEGSLDLAAQTAQVRIAATDLALAAAQPYLAAATPARLTGGTVSAAAQVRADWSKSPADVTLSDGRVGLKGVKIALPGAETPSLSLDGASAAIAKVDLAARIAAIDKIEVAGLAVDVQRLADGGIDLAALAAPQTAQNDATPAAAQADAPVWHYGIGEIDLKDGRATFVDHTLPGPAKVEVAPLNLTIRNFGDDPSAAFPLRLAATLNGKGAVSLDGDVTLDPLKVEMKFTGDRVDLTPFAAFAADAANADLARALLNADGGVGFELTPDGPRASYRGNLELADVRVINRASSSPFAGWRSLALKGLAVRYDAAGGVDLDAANVAFSNFYGRVLLDEQGRLHLHDILAKDDAPSPKPQPAAAAAPAKAPPPVRLHFGRVELRNGQVTYTDNFIRPHYTAELTAIDGTIGTFGTAVRAPAAVNVAARLTANGPISIKGTVNPLAASPSLDLTAAAKGIELTNLTAYSTKYTGYPITKGKLNVDLHYKLADERLSADNHVFIDQLTFGERIENDTATQLPVQLAIALLKNSDGQIDVDIPVSGSLNDPEFSISGLVWSAVGNLIQKAVTAPFTLLAHAFGLGGGEELGYVEFAPGSADLPEAAQGKLDTIAKMLAEKPSVSLDLIGRVDPGIDDPALRDAYVERLVRRQKLKDLGVSGGKDDAADVKIVPSEYPRYLKDVYRAALAKQPRKAPAAPEPETADETRAALAAMAPIDDAALTRLAQARAQAVRDYLAGKIADTRVFVVAPKLTAADIDDKGATTRVDFSLK